MKNSKVDKYLFDGGYAQASVADFQPYKYNGKELDKMHGLNTYDHGARQYDPIQVPGYMAPPPSRKGDATYLSPGTTPIEKEQEFVIYPQKDEK